MDVPQSLLTSFQKFAEYPTNFFFEPNPTDVRLISYRDRLDKSTQTKYILVQFLDLEISHTESNAAVPSTVISVDRKDADISNDADLKKWIEAGVKGVVQPPSAPAVIGNPIPALNNDLNQQRLSSLTQTGRISRQQSTSSQHNIPAHHVSQNPIPDLVLAPVSQVQQAQPALRAFVKDPQCRFIFLHAGHSRNPLRISRNMLARILTHHQVMAGFIDFISVFKKQAGSRGQRYFGFKVKSQLSPQDAISCSSLRRSGVYYQICYNLRSAGSSTNNIWTIRQTVFHHQFDVVHGTALWISAKGDQEMRSLIGTTVKRPEYTQYQDSGKCFASTLKIHMLHCRWCTKGWLEYIEYLESELENMENELEPLMAGQTPGSLIDGPATREITLADLQRAQFVERKSKEVLITLDANVNILTSLRDYYTNLVDNTAIPAAWAPATEDFSRNLKNRESEIHRFEARSKRLVQLAADQKSLIIKQLEFQSSRKMEQLSYSTYALGILAQREALAMRIITIVSLIYLPCSVVSSVFSTDIVKFQTGTIGIYQTSFSWLALQRWLEVTLPLTLLTLTLGLFGYRFEKKRQAKDLDRETEAMMGQPVDSGTPMTPTV